MNRKYKKVIAAIWGVMGIIILISVAWPILKYEVDAKSKYPILISSNTESGQKVLLEDYDYTRASNWFPGAKEERDFIVPKVTFYTISIPYLNIEDATVAIGGEDLKENLIQYPGTAVPGKMGNTVIFGHSILPYFFDPEDYLSIFSTLPTLEKGNVITVNYDGISYTYVVENMFEVEPTNIEILEQSLGDSYITLVTCTPPGHPLKPKRLIVKARLVPAKHADANTWN